MNTSHIYIFSWVLRPISKKISFSGRSIEVHFLWTNNDKRGFRETVFLFCCLVFLSIMYLDLNRIDVMLAFCTSCIRLKNFANSSSFQYVLTCLWEKNLCCLSFCCYLIRITQMTFQSCHDLFSFSHEIVVGKILLQKRVFFFLHCRERERPPKIWSLVEQKSVPKCTHNALYYAMKKVQWSTRFSIKSKNINVIFVF